MASRTSNQAWFRRKYILQILTAELQTENLAYFQRKIQLNGFPAFLDSSPSQLIRIRWVQLYSDLEFTEVYCSTDYIRHIVKLPVNNGMATILKKAIVTFGASPESASKDWGNEPVTRLSPGQNPKACPPPPSLTFSETC